MTPTVLVLNWLNLASRRKIHKCNLVFKCLNKLVSKYLTQYFTRNADLHDFANNKSLNLQTTKPKRNMGKRTLKHKGIIYFNSLPNCVKRAMSVNSFKTMMIIIKYFTL